MKAESGIRCPRCKSQAWYRFGKTATGKRRYLCQVCARQFIVDYAYKFIIKHRPLCPVCGEHMHVYMRDGSHIRFRCSSYPNCRGFLKTDLESSGFAPGRTSRSLPTDGNHFLRKEVGVQ
jgi:transposase-like protein